MNYFDEIKTRLDNLESLKFYRPGIQFFNCPYKVGWKTINKNLQQRINQYRNALKTRSPIKEKNILKSILSLEIYLRKSLYPEDICLYSRVFDLYKKYRSDFRNESKNFIEEFFATCINRLKKSFLTGYQLDTLYSLETIFTFKGGKGGGKDYNSIDEFIELNVYDNSLPKTPKRKIKQKKTEEKLRSS